MIRVVVLLVAVLGGFVLGFNACREPFPGPADPELTLLLKPAIDELITDPEVRLVFVNNALKDIGEDNLKRVVFLLLLDLRPDIKQRPMMMTAVKRGIGIKD